MKFLIPLLLISLALTLITHQVLMVLMQQEIKSQQQVIEGMVKNITGIEKTDQMIIDRIEK